MSQHLQQVHGQSDFDKLYIAVEAYGGDPNKIHQNFFFEMTWVKILKSPNTLSSAAKISTVGGHGSQMLSDHILHLKHKADGQVEVG